MLLFCSWALLKWWFVVGCLTLVVRDLSGKSGSIALKEWLQSYSVLPSQVQRHNMTNWCQKSYGLLANVQVTIWCWPKTRRWIAWLSRWSCLIPFATASGSWKLPSYCSWIRRICSRTKSLSPLLPSVSKNTLVSFRHRCKIIFVQ